MEANLMV